MIVPREATTLRVGARWGEYRRLDAEESSSSWREHAEPSPRERGFGLRATRNDARSDES